MRDASGANDTTLEPPAVYTVAEVAAILNVAESTINDDCRRGNFPHVRIGRRVLIPRRRFEAWLNGTPGLGSGVESTAQTN